MTQWLNERERRAWRAFAEARGPLNGAMEHDLAEFGLSYGDYEVLVILSESPDQCRRMCDLSDLLGLSPSGLTRRLDGLVRSGHVERMPSSHDRRVTLAHLTPEGMTKLEGAVPTHVDSVRRHFIDCLTAEQLDVLGDAFLAIGSKLGRIASLN